MKAFDLDPYLQGGLRLDKDDSLGTDCLLKAYGCKISAFGAVPAPDIFCPFPVAVAAPFPALFKNEKNHLVLATEDKVYTVDDSWALTEQQLMTLGSYVNSVLTPVYTTISSPGQWHHADFTGGWMLFNGQAMVISYPNVGVFCSTAPLAGTGCFYKNRMVFGDVASFFSAAYRAKVNSLTGETLGPLTQQSLLYTATDCEDLMWYLFPWSLTTKDRYLRLMERQEGNDLNLPWAEKTLCVKPLGEGVMVYTKEQALYLELKGNMLAFGREFSFGSCSRAVGGDKNVHAFIDSEGRLRLLGADLKYKVVGGREYFEQLSPESIAITPFETVGDFVVTGDRGSWLLHNDKLSELPYRVPSVVSVGGTPMGCYEENIDRSFRLLTGIIQAPTPLFTAKGIQVSSNNPVALRGSFHYRDSSGGFKSTPMEQLGADGVLDLHQTATEFAVELEGDSYRDCCVRSLQLLYNDDRVAL